LPVAIFDESRDTSTHQEVVMKKSEENLAAAFAGESQANRRYLAFAKQAEKDGYAQAARLFRAAAEAETIHAHSHLRALGGIKSTKENLMEAVAGETHEFKDMYPAMIADAVAEGATQAERSFRFANEVEKVHAQLYQNMLDTLQPGGESFDYYICSVCGHTVERESPDKCVVCGAKGSVFFKAP
jgi:rubrerythrin